MSGIFGYWRKIATSIMTTSICFLASQSVAQEPIMYQRDIAKRLLEKKPIAFNYDYSNKTISDVYLSEPFTIDDAVCNFLFLDRGVITERYDIQPDGKVGSDDISEIVCASTRGRERLRDFNNDAEPDEGESWCLASQDCDTTKRYQEMIKTAHSQLKRRP